MFTKFYWEYIKSHPHCSSEEASSVASQMTDRRCGIRNHRLPASRHYNHDEETNDYNDFDEDDY